MLVELKYKTKDRYSCTKLNHILFGQLNHQRHKGKRYIYYRPGLLHDIPFFKRNVGKYFIITENVNIDKIYDTIHNYADIEINEVPDMQYLSLPFKTGQEHWKEHAERWGKRVIWTKE